MFRYKYVLPLLLLLFSVNAHAGRETALINPQPVTIVTSSGKTLSMEEIRKAMTIAGGSLQWVITPAGDGKATGTIDVRGKHRLIVDIAYSPKSFAVSYKDSSNLNYGKDLEGVTVIHPNANRWMNNLSDAIRVELLRH